jgi:hypothetical protein
VKEIYKSTSQQNKGAYKHKQFAGIAVHDTNLHQLAIMMKNCITGKLLQVLLSSATIRLCH